MIDGFPHCPSTPDELVHITRPAQLSVAPLKRNADRLERARRDKQVTELAAFEAQVARRQQYAFRMVATARPRAKDQNKVRWECPAQAGKVRCANCPMSQLLDAETTPEIEAPPELETAPTPSARSPSLAT